MAASLLNERFRRSSASLLTWYVQGINFGVFMLNKIVATSLFCIGLPVGIAKGIYDNIPQLVAVGMGRMLDLLPEKKWTMRIDSLGGAAQQKKFLV